MLCSSALNLSPSVSPSVSESVSDEPRYRAAIEAKKQNLFGLSIRTSMQNLESVDLEMSELCSILRFGSHFVFWQPFCFSKICQNLFRLSIGTSM